MVVHEVGMDRGGTELAGDYAFFWAECYINKEFISAIRKIKFVSGKIPYIILKKYV
jgi:hypothetical protein